jgi:hypothetical protein
MTGAGCSRRHIPAQESAITVNNAASPVPNTTPVRKATMIPRVIVVSEAAAKKSVDGRMYYDLEGRRYWRNYDDGKYYLFNKAMYANKAFKPH